MRRPNLPLFLAVAALAGGIIGFTIYAKENESPFAFGMSRPGVEFSEMDDDSQRNQGRRFACTPIDGGYRVCEVSTDGPPGKMRVAVDDAGRVIVLRMTISETSPRVADLTDKVRKQWNGVDGDGVLRTAATQQVIDWRTNDGRWSARMRLRSLSLGMEEMSIADERALGRLIQGDEKALPTAIELVRRGLISDTLLTAAERRAPGTMLRAADARSTGARQRSTAMRSLPRCAGNLVQVQDYTAPDELLGQHAAIVQQAVATAYGGRRIVVAEQPYLVDAADVGEAIAITPPTDDETGERVAFAITFTARADSSTAAVDRGERPRRCRAVADVIVARIDTSLRKVTEVRGGELEPDGWVTRARTLHFFVGDERRPLIASYESTYADSSWVGEVAWQATLTSDSLVALRRNPISFRKTSGGRTVGGRLLPDVGSGAPAGDADPFAGRIVIVLPLEDSDGSAPYPVMLPSAVNGTANGWTLLAMF
ncbi:MAG TPA: hypothetical protein VHM67_01200 [Gemmatimonadaceae bacterium]|nr:hypothetical protein [Gemmatimonadaceae bacterium]